MSSSTASKQAQKNEIYVQISLTWQMHNSAKYNQPCCGIAEAIYWCPPLAPTGVQKQTWMCKTYHNFQ